MRLSVEIVDAPSHEVVTLSAIKLPRCAFQRRVDEPSEIARSASGVKYPPATDNMKLPFVLVMMPSS